MKLTYEGNKGRTVTIFLPAHEKFVKAAIAMLEFMLDAPRRYAQSGVKEDEWIPREIAELKSLLQPPGRFPKAELKLCENVSNGWFDNPNRRSEEALTKLERDVLQYRWDRDRA